MTTGSDSVRLEQDMRQWAKLAIVAPDHPVLCVLNLRQYRVFVARYLTDPPVPDKLLAAELGVSAPRIWQIQRFAMRRVRTAWARLMQPDGE